MNRLFMTFSSKWNDKTININLDQTHLKDVLQYCKPKEQLVLFKKFALDGGQEVALQKIGEKYGLTRERVRQIASQGLMRFRRLIVGNAKYLTMLDHATEILEEHGGILSEEELIAKLLNSKRYDFSAQEIKLVLISDFNIYALKRNRHISSSFYIEPLYEDFLTNIAIFTKEHFAEQSHASNYYEFIDTCKDWIKENYIQEYEVVQKNNFYDSFFKVIRGVAIFDGKIGLDSFVEVNPKTIKQKILYLLRKIHKPLHYQEIASQLIEQFPQKPVKSSTVHNELVKNNEIFVNMGLGIYGLKEWGYKGGTVKEIVIRILDKNERAMTVKEIAKEVLKEKMVSPNTVVLTLQKYNNLFERVGKGVYQKAPTS